ncbi:MAG: hypothetical protein ACYC27_11390 [Armatimonadota bacterium]
MKVNRKPLMLIIMLAMISAFIMVPCVAQTAVPTDLGVLGTNHYNYAVGINDSGLIAGYSFYVSDYNYLMTALVWEPGDMTPTALPLQGSDPYSEVLRQTNRSPVNTSGLVVGASYHYDNSGHPVYQACMWQQVDGNWTVTGLGFLPNTEHDSSDPYAMNASGKVVGRSSKNGTEDWGGFIWDRDNGMQPFTNLPDGSKGTSVTLIPRGGISDNGYVVGEAMASGNTLNGGVIWDSTTKTTIGYLEYGIPTAISPSGLVTGYDYETAPSSPTSLDVFLFIWSYNNGSPVEQNLGQPTVTPPVGLSESDLVGMDIHPTAINDNGQIVGYGYAYWNGLEATEFHWMWDGTQFIELKTVLPIGTPAINYIYPSLSANGMVALTVTFENYSNAAYLWNGNASDPAVALEGLGGESAVFNINDTGQLAGMSLSSNDSKYHACAWGLSTPPPTSALTISDLTVTTRKGKTLTVTVKISNPNDTMAYDVTVTSASLSGVDSNSSLPLVYGSIKPGASKKCTLQFKNVPSGVQDLTIQGTSSLGDFFTTKSVTVP